MTIRFYDGKFGYDFSQPSITERLENGDPGWQIGVPIHFFGAIELENNKKTEKNVSYSVAAEIGDFAEFSRFTESRKGCTIPLSVGGSADREGL